MTAMMSDASPKRVFHISFRAPGSPQWLQAAPRTRWKFIGDGEFVFDGSDVVVTGRRSRSFLPAARQEIRFPRESVINVLQTDRQIHCEVKWATGNEPLRFWADDANAAQSIAADLPTERSEQFARVADDKLAFDRSLDSIDSRVVVTPVLVGINVLVFVLMLVAGANWMAPDGELMVRWGSNYGPSTLSGEWWRLFTCMFLHFGIIHIALNMWVLWSSGPLIEKLFGSVYFALLYVFAGLCGSLASLYWHPDVNSAGASGAIFGLFGGLLAFMLNPATRVPPSVMTAQLKSTLIFIAYNLLNGATHTGIDNAAHIGGLAGGLAIGFALARPLHPEARIDGRPRFAWSALTAVMALVALSWPLVHPGAEKMAEQKFWNDFRLFGALEAQANGEEKQLQKDAMDRKLTELQWGQGIKSRVLPIWNSAQQRLAANPLPDSSPLKPLQAMLLKYVEQHELGMQWLADSTATHRPEDLQKGKALIAESKISADQAIVLIKAARQKN
jgi:rhomboid protease GluP